MAWPCFPRWHSSGMLSALIGGPGAYALSPRGHYVWGGSYEAG
jgi:hypothetical protein